MLPLASLVLTTLAALAALAAPTTLVAVPRNARRLEQGEEATGMATRMRRSRRRVPVEERVRPEYQSAEDPWHVLLEPREERRWRPAGIQADANARFRERVSSASL
jgi:hypothetical protein